jgi:hypothetical protein
MGPTKVRIASLMALAAGGVGFGLLVACGTSAPAPQASAVEVENAIQASCMATMPPSCPASTPHYADVAPILEKSCVPCHPGPAGAPQWPLTVYGDIAPWAGVIQDEVCGNTMPPADGGIGIDPSDRLTILDWVQCGAPE